VNAGRENAADDHARRDMTQYGAQKYRIHLPLHHPSKR
jgi:hypothetical protein